MVRLAQEIDEAKGELYSALEAEKSLINKKVYFLSSKLDKLILEYQLKLIKSET
ncbi:MAG: Spo0E family sporulation regulatory protein-aspartic acid phosphatase [Tepidanaerobacter acetatoxydans]|uniref:Sporulation stage 0, Spo0E-like regulatory phosphatase n=1 Tax=Tepidanaerobacter acetatoxydans (strain DSM 21804 / JCM 16047 / Re1) TaxID=1209989 RepID=F4LT05_TEPAE|nr:MULTISPECIES: aspartyl-phosphate phosphatase Spo0E family protein [Tepidanaerobacter]AEE91274.1 hypothetical protein TepRe1_1128 [Tepidanaerobacter acetatoxydans Re1]NLU10567.1 Spo0E family sporulation regulatory protein-aspartic acid phosphatase [Tepidanaerobacter acetatoxydans]CCP25960.1 conserved protein of unknown function [Tepidanaerobacter acetatoxydans Re1]